MDRLKFHPNAERHKEDATIPANVNFCTKSNSLSIFFIRMCFFKCLLILRLNLSEVKEEFINLLIFIVFMFSVKNLILGIGIFIVYMLMLGYGIEAFYPSPKYDDFCKAEGGRYPIKAYDYGTGANCTFSRNLQEAQEQCYADGGQPIFEYDDNGCTIAIEKCDFCNKEFNDANKKYSKIIFVISLIAGIITLFLGFAILSIEPVGSALMASGVGAIIYGSIRNWQNLSDVWRFLLLLAALVLLIWIALRLNRKKEGFWQKLGIKK